MAKIVKDSLRVGHSQLEAENDMTLKENDMDERSMIIAGAARWHHFECFPRMKGAKWMAANLPESPAKLEGFKKLKKSDQKKLLDLWKAMNGSVSAKRPAEETKGMKKPAAKVAKLSSLTSVQGVLSAAEYKKISAVENSIASMTSEALLAELRKNDQPRKGKKEELVSRVAEGRILGALPSCPKCKHGQIHWSRLGGWFSCPGYFDKAMLMTKRCSFRSKEMNRTAWKK